MEIEITPFFSQVTKDNQTDNLEIDNQYWTYDEFFKTFIYRNIPCKIKNICNHWESTKYWVNNCKPDFTYLSSKYSKCTVNVYNCNEKYFNSQKVDVYKFQKYLEYWANYINKNYPKDMPVLYLKDWHLKNELSNDNFYEVPEYFASDWLNEYLCAKNMDDYRFVYMGPKGTWTPFHADVFTSYSWSVNICGRKKWLFFKPGTENHFKDPLGNLIYDVTKANDYQNNCIEMFQEAGEAIFVPSGWYHQVYNLADTISINHNWINGCNILKMWISLEDHLEKIKKEIEDCKDMDDFIEHCQVMLQASYGMNFIGFYNLLHFIAFRRIKLMKENVEIDLPNNRKLGKVHAVFDLNSVQNVLKLITNHSDFNTLSQFDDLETHPTVLLKNINDILSDKSVNIVYR